MASRVLFAAWVSACAVGCVAGANPPGDGVDERGLPVACTAPEVQPSAIGCAIGERGYLSGSSVASGSSGTARLMVPITGCPTAGDRWSIEAEGQDRDAIATRPSVLLEVCGEPEQGIYAAVGRSGIAFELQLGVDQPRYVSDDQTECTVCLSEDGRSGDYECTGLKRVGEGTPERRDVSGAFVCP